MKAERQKAVLEYILVKGSATIADLAERFGVSLMTVRRDLSALEEGGLIKRLAGKAVAVGDPQKEPPYKVRMYYNPLEKEKIATITEGLIEDGEVIFLGMGSTCLQVAKRLRDRRLVVVTNWIPNMVELASSPNCEVINTGGLLNKEELSSVGSLASETLSTFTVTKAIIGAAGVTGEAISDFRLASVEIMRRAMQCAKQVIVVADHSKFGVVAPVRIASLDRVDRIVVSDIAKVNGELLRQIESCGVEIISQ